MKEIELTTSYEVVSCSNEYKKVRIITKICFFSEYLFVIKNINNNSFDIEKVRNPLKKC